MRALVFHGPGDMRVEEVPDPVPTGDEVLLRVTATGICGSDLHGYTGETGRRHPGQIMGHETVGRVVGTGAIATVNPVIGCGACRDCDAGVEQWCSRRRIIGVEPAIPAAFAELMVVPARNVVELPSTMGEQFGALVEPLAVGYHAAGRGEVTSDDRVLVIGGGPIGQACALGARRLGATAIVVSEPNPSRRALVSKLDLVVVDSGLVKQTAPDLLGGPATVVLDAVGTSTSLTDAFAVASLGARIVLVGMNAPEVTLAAYAVSTHERSIIGSFCYSTHEFRQTAEWVAAGPSGLEHLIEGRTSLDGAPDAFAGLASGDLDASKILVLL